MIPITVSFFLNQSQAASEPKRGGWTQALVFCLGIIVLFTGLGFLVTAIAGPFGVVQLGSSPWVNGFIALVFFVFGLSLLGRVRASSAFRTADETESGIAGRRLCRHAADGADVFADFLRLHRPDRRAAADRFRAVERLAAGSGHAGVCHRAGRAFFFCWRCFPSYLQNLPRSGGWMARVKDRARVSSCWR